MVMRNWSNGAKVDCPREGDFVDDFFKEEINMIKNNDTTLNATGYFNVDELE